MSKKVYSRVDEIPKGFASDKITPGCIVLEGGGFRGVYTSGVLDTLMLEDINLECTVGVSAGALNGVNYVSGQIGRSGRVNLTYRHDPRYVGLRNYFKHGAVINLDFCLRPQVIEPLNAERFYSPAQRFIVVSTNCQTGESEYFEQGKVSDIMEATKSSSSLPYISKMVNVDGTLCLDGGCSTKLAYEWAIEQGYEKIVVVRTRKPDFRYPEGKKNRLASTFYRKWPAFVKTVSESESKYNAACDKLDALQAQGRVFVLSPSQPVNIGRLEPDMEKLGALYELGRTDTQAALEDLKHYLGI